MSTRRRYWSLLDAPTRRHLKGWATGLLLIVVAIIVGCVVHAPFKVFVVECLAILLGVFSTPVFFESSLFIVGVVIVLGIAALRGRVEKSEWVEIGAGEEGAGTPGGGRFSKGKADAASDDEEVEITLAVVEGYLDLELPEEAWDALVAVPRRAWEEPRSLKVRLRTYALTARWREGEKIIGMAEATDGLARDAALYHLAHARALVGEGVSSGEAPSERAAKQSAAAVLRRAVRLDPGVVDEINAEPVLRQCVKG